MSETPSIATTVGFQRRIAAVVASMGALAASQAVAQSTIHVVENALPGGDGLTWETAVPTVYEAIELASAYSGSLTVTGIKVAQGRYFVTDPVEGNALDSIVLLSGVTLSGGFRGPNAGGDPNEQDPGAFVSLLDGDIGVPGNSQDNSSRAVSLRWGEFVIDGITFQNFLLNAIYGSDLVGATISRCTVKAGGHSMAYGITIAFAQEWAIIDQCRFEGVACDYYLVRLSGAQIAVRDCEFTGTRCGWSVLRADAEQVVLVEDCTIVDASSGKALVHLQSEDSVEVNRCEVVANGGLPGSGASPLLIRSTPYVRINDSKVWNNNTGTFFGGGIALENVNVANLERCAITGNTAISHGGGLFASVDSVLNLLDCLIAENVSGGFGGGIWTNVAAGAHFCTIADNRAVEANGAGIFVAGVPMSASSCILWGNHQFGAPPSSATVDTQVWPPSTALHDSIVQGATALPTVVSMDPRFVAPSDYHLRPDSPAINRGHYKAFLVWISYSLADLDGMPRVAGAFADAGCYEARDLPTPCGRADLTTHLIAGLPGYRLPDGRLTTDDLFCFLEAFQRQDIAADFNHGVNTWSKAEYQYQDFQITNDDFFAYLELYRLGC